MGAYLTPSPSNCLVFLSSGSINSTSKFYPGLPPSGITTQHGMHDFNVLYPGYITVPTHCQKATAPPPKGPRGPGASGPAPNPPPPAPPAPPPPPPATGTDSPPTEAIPGPITGDPPPDECGDGYYIPRPAIGIDEPTISLGGSGASGGLGASGTGGNSPRLTMDEQIEEDTQPLVAGLTPMLTLVGNKPVYTQLPYFQVRTGENQAIMDALHEGTGPGVLLLHPPEFQDYHLRGTNDNGDAKWPTNISESGLMLMNSVRDDASTGDNAVSLLSFGKPLRGTTRPASGHYFKEDLTTGELCIQGTNASGADDNSKGVCVNGFPVMTKEQRRITASDALDWGADYVTVFVNSDAGDVTYQLPVYEAGHQGTIFKVINSGTNGNTVTVTVATGEFLSGEKDGTQELNDGDDVDYELNDIDGWF